MERGNGELSPLQRLTAEKKGWTLRKLAEESGVDLWKIRMASCGTRNLKEAEAKKVAKALGVATEKLPTFSVTWSD